MDSGLPIALAGFSNWFMLAWGASALIPIALHLLNRRQQASIPWAAMQLLRQVIEQESRRARLAQLLLLLIRILMLLLLAIILASPFWSDSDDSGVSPLTRAPKLWVIAIDTSYSMGYRGEEGARIEVAKQHAAEVVASGQQGDAYALVTLGQPAQAVIVPPTYDSSGMLSEVQRLSALSTDSDVVGGLEMIQRLTEDRTQDPTLPQDVHILILSDLGEDAWGGIAQSQDAALLSKLFQEHTVEFDWLGQRETSNLAILSLEPSTSRAIAGNSLSVVVTVASYGADSQQVPVQLEMDGQTVASQFVDLQEGVPRPVRFEVDPRVLGSAVLAAELPVDSLMADNRREHVIEVREAYRVLIVENEVGDSRMLRLALQPSEVRLGSQSIAVVSKLDWPNVELSNWDVVILQDVRGLTASHLERLNHWVEQGGAALVMIGANMTLEQWAGFSGPAEQLLGIRLLAPSAPDEPVTLDPLEYRSPVVAPFAGFPDSGLLTTPVFRYWRTAPAASDSALQVDLATTSGDPLIFRRPHGLGWVACILSAPEDGRDVPGRDSWNAIATWPSFLPLSQQLVQAILNTQSKRNNVLAGESIRVVNFGQTESSTIRVSRPDGTTAEMVSESLGNGQGEETLYRSTDLQGLYRFQVAGSDEQVFAVNINPIESSLSFVDPQQFTKRWSAETNPLRQNKVANVVESERDYLARYLLWGLFGLAFTESIVAWFLGRRVG